MHSFTKEVHHVDDLTQIFYRSIDTEFIVRFNLSDDGNWWIKMYMYEGSLVLNLNSERATMLTDVLLDIQKVVKQK